MIFASSARVVSFSRQLFILAIALQMVLSSFLLHVTAGAIDSHVILPICPQPCHFASYAINATKRAMASQEEMIFSIMSLIAQDVSVQISKRR